MPYSEIYTTEFDEREGDWIKNYVFNTFEYAVIILPLIFSLIMIPKDRKQSAKKILMTILCLFSVLAFLFALQSLSMPIQDFAPSWGMLVLIFLFPIVIIDVRLEWKGENKKI